MRLDRIHASNYRTLEDFTISFHSNYCTLSGHNNAGKSCLIRLVLNLLGSHSDIYWDDSNYAFSYEDDYTQWKRVKSPMRVEYIIIVHRYDDTELFSLLEKLTALTFSDESVKVRISITVEESNQTTTEVQLNGVILDSVLANNFLARLKSADNLFLHNSTQNHNGFLVHRGKSALMYDLSLSQRDKKTISDAEANLQRQLKKVTKEHKSQLKAMLGRLHEQHDVEISTLDLSSRSRHMPLTINLRDRNVDIPLTSWGSGTQNRTHILMSILKANRIKTREKADSRITPIVLIEEPESFLHPSAQAEFGRVLQSISEELKIQIIVSTHSPYMLNQAHPQSNILLKRRIARSKEYETVTANTSGEEWMRPFADHLGIIPNELAHWKDILANRDKKVLMVEGEIDKGYVEHLRTTYPSKFSIPVDVEILSYGGKDALKNTAILSFMLKVVSRAFITFDLDAYNEVKRPLGSLGLTEKVDFVPIGRDQGGQKCIEGLLPPRIRQQVYGTHTDLVDALSGSTEDRNSAKSKLKRLLLEEFKKHDDYSDDELRGFEQLSRIIAKGFA